MCFTLMLVLLLYEECTYINTHSSDTSVSEERRMFRLDQFFCCEFCISDLNILLLVQSAALNELVFLPSGVFCYFSSIIFHRICNESKEKNHSCDACDWLANTLEK